MALNRLRNLVVGAFAVSGVGYGFMTKVATIAEVDGPSMQPALNPVPGESDYIFIDKLSVDKISRGDIVTLISPKDKRKTLVKRVVGLENDVIHTKGYKTEFVRVPEKHVWVEGDNTGRTLDSNIFGPVSLDKITGKVISIVWPIKRWQILTPVRKDEVIIHNAGELGTMSGQL